MLEANAPDLWVHSPGTAVRGSARAARRGGPIEAASATIDSSSGTPANVRASQGKVPLVIKAVSGMTDHALPLDQPWPSATSLDPRRYMAAMTAVAALFFLELAIGNAWVPLADVVRAVVVGDASRVS